MATNPHTDDTAHITANYIDKKGITELFEAMITALMVHKPDDHISFIRECLDKVQHNPNHIRWDYFLAKRSTSQSALSPKSSFAQTRQKRSPSVNSTSIKSAKASLLPLIDKNKMNSLYSPIIFILSSTGSTKLCSRLLQRYHQISYLFINNIANIDEDDNIDLSQHEHRYGRVEQAVEQHRSSANGFLIVGELDEQNYLQQWQEKLGRIDLVLILSVNTHQTREHQNFHIIQIDSTNDFETILANAIHALDELFPQDAFVSERSHPIVLKTSHFSLPILFCIDNHRIPIKKMSKENLLIDEEFEMINEKNEEENNNSFISTLCQRVAEEFTFKHIHYGDFNKILLNFDQLKNEIIQSMSSCSGYIIDHFPTSFNDLQRFQSEIGPCSTLIYIGERKIVTKHDELNEIIEKFREDKKAVYVDCRMEVDEIYDDLKNNILEHI